MEDNLIELSYQKVETNWIDNLKKIDNCIFEVAKFKVREQVNSVSLRFNGYYPYDHMCDTAIVNVFAVVKLNNKFLYNEAIARTYSGCEG